MSLRKILSAVAAFILAMSAIGYSQQATVMQQGNTRLGHESKREGRRRPAKIGRPGNMGLMRELNLTEAQREQQRAILQRHLGITRAAREELFRLCEKRIAGTFDAEDETQARVLTDEIRSSRESMRSEMQRVLTSEQSARLEQLQSERKSPHKEMRERRLEGREAIPR